MERATDDCERPGRRGSFGRVTNVAYGLVPVDRDGNHVPGARYIYTADGPVAVGTRVQLRALGFDQWEVVRVLPPRTDPSPQDRIVSVCDASGNKVPVLGTLVIRRVTALQTADDS